MLIQLNPPIPVVTPLGAGEAVGWIDLSNEHDLQWICFIAETRACVIFRTPYIRQQENLTMGRERIDPKKLFATQRMAGKLRIFERFASWLGGL